MSEDTGRRFSNRESGWEVDLNTKPTGGREKCPCTNRTLSTVRDIKRSRCTGYISTRTLEATTGQRPGLAKNHSVEASFTQRRPLRKSGPCGKCHHTKCHHTTDQSESASDVLRRLVMQRQHDHIILILQTFQILAAARGQMTFSQLNVASGTWFRLLHDHHGEGQLSGETQNRIVNGEVNYVRLCGDLLNVKSSGIVEFSHKDMQRAVCSPGFQQNFGLRNADETLAAICIQHLGCAGEMSEGMASARTIKCPITGQATCTLRAYAAWFWKRHYLATNGGSQWIHSLLHDAVVSYVAKGGCTDMQCQRHCNRVLATGLEMAATHDLHVIGRMYVQMGAEVGPCSHSSHTPLHTAVANSSANMVKLLLRCGANPNAFANDTSKPLCGINEDVIPCTFVNCGLKHNEECHCWQCCGCASGQTPLHIAAAIGEEETLRLLVASGAHIDIPTMFHANTALHLAAKSGSTVAVQYLIASGADFRSQNFAGETALQVALKEHHHSIAKLLRLAACPVTHEPRYEGTPQPEAGLGENNPSSPTWNMQTLSLEDKPKESPARELREVEATNTTERISGVTQPAYSAREELCNHGETWVLV